MKYELNLIVGNSLKRFAFDTLREVAIAITTSQDVSKRKGWNTDYLLISIETDGTMTVLTGEELLNFVS